MLSWLVCLLLLALMVACWALEAAHGAYLGLLDLYCPIQPQTPLDLRALRRRARLLRDLYRALVPLSACASVVWAGVALRWW